MQQTYRQCAHFYVEDKLIFAAPKAQTLRRALFCGLCAVLLDRGRVIYFSLRRKASIYTEGSLQ
jgi:hypothetical protein